ncbi:hypothetical protein AOQ73_05830 [Bradyrhizobium pachyrhizi]|nr:hypothetical protein AOQ73_05830 [Bradyrhizobium pachyrhizi]
MPAVAPPIAAPAPPPVPTTHDVTVVSTKKLASAKVLGVPPEEFGIERGARDIKTCNYCFHDVVTKTAAQLIAEGYDEAQIGSLIDYTGLTEIETLDRDTVSEHLSGDSAGGGVANAYGRLVKITEHYIRMDYEGTGRPELYQVVTGGDQGEVLRKDGKDCITTFDAMPFAYTTPVPQTHRFFGRSIADLVMATQREKTALKRGILDNLYLRNNPRVEVAEQNAGPNTLDDLLVSRPGGVVRTKQVGGVVWQTVPDVTSSIYPMMQYLDAELETRTGLSKQSQGLDANALQNQSATAAAQVFSASQMRMKLIARITGEGVRDIFALLHATIRKHGQQKQTVRLRNKWVPIDPRTWKERSDMTISVALGTGGKAQQFAQTMAIGNVQKEMAAAGKTNLVGDSELYNTAVELTRIMGHKNPDRFFKNPDAKDAQGNLVNPPPQPQPDPKTQAIRAKAEADKQAAVTAAQLDQQKATHQAQLDEQAAQNDFIHQQVSAQMQKELAHMKATLDARLKILDAHIRAAESAQAAQHRHEAHTATVHHAHERHHMDMTTAAAGLIAAAQAHDHGMAQRDADHKTEKSE